MEIALNDIGEFIKTQPFTVGVIFLLITLSVTLIVMTILETRSPMLDDSDEYGC